MVKIEDLYIGCIVRLAGGSPKMVVERIAPAQSLPPGQRGPAPQLVHVVWWNDRTGLHRERFAPELLVYPRPVAAEPEAPPEAAE